MGSYKVEVAGMKCIACGTCYSGHSLFIESDEAGFAKVIGGENDGCCSFRVFNDGNLDQVKANAAYCPVSAITVTEA